MQMGSLYDVGFWPEMPDMPEDVPGWELPLYTGQPDFAKCVESNPGSAIAHYGGSLPAIDECSPSSSDPSAPHNGASEPLPRDKVSRKTTQNRQAQQRFRQRHKVSIPGLCCRSERAYHACTGQPCDAGKNELSSVSTRRSCQPDRGAASQAAPARSQECSAASCC